MNLKEHLAREHKISPFSTYLKEIVYGGNDGIVTTFAIVAGFAGAQSSPEVASVPFISVLLFGLANLFADGVSMSLGSFLSLRAEKDVYGSEKAKELHEIEIAPHMEFEETVDILKSKGFTLIDANAVANLFAKNPSYWTEFMMHDELEMPNPEKENPWLVGLVTFVSFVTFGSIPLIPYIFFPGAPQIFYQSILATFVALLILGVMRWRVSHRSFAQSVAETLLLGGVAALVAYTVGTFFRAH